jgi:DNA-binding NarL/FixJ family response regulator
VVIGRQTLLCALLVEGLHARIEGVDVVGLRSVAEIDRDPGRLSGRDIRLIVLHACTSENETPTSVGEIATLCGHDVPCMLLVNQDDSRTALLAAANGFKAVLSTTASVDIAAAVVRLVLAGGIYIPSSLGEPAEGYNKAERRAIVAPRLGPHLEAPVTESTAKSDFVRIGLTERERRVLAELCRGRPNKIIARELSISENTAKMHVRRILAKLRVNNRTEAALMFQSQFGTSSG